MKPVKQFLFAIVLVVLAHNALAQEQTVTQQFPLGFFLGEYQQPSEVDTIYNQLERLGANYIIQYAPLNSTEPLSDYNLVAVKEDSPNDYISYFSRGYYTKWESEENQTNLLATGVKHIDGTEETYLGKQCWSSSGLTSATDKFVYGPDYRQDKYYRLNYDKSHIFYTAKFVLGFEYPYNNPNPEDNVCKIAVVHRYRLLVNECYMGDVIDTLDNTSVVLKVSDFPHNQFLEKSLTYNYPGNIPNQNISEHLLSNVITSDTLFDDEYPGYGIQFIVDWYGVGTLYVDYVEVFDNTIWGVYLSNIQLHSEEIISFANNYSSWNFLKYWYVADEPHSMDAFTPIHIVDSLVRSVQGGLLITEFYPSWKPVNGRGKQFAPGKRLIIDGLATVKGTAAQKLTLDFHDRNDNTGIEVLSDEDFTASKKLMLLK